MESKKQKGRLFARGEDTLEKYSDRSKQVGSPTHYIHKSIFANMERRNLYSHINFNPHLAAPIPSLKFSKPPPSSSPILAKDTLRQNIQDSNIFTQILNSSKDQLNKKLDDMQIYETKITCQKTFLEKQRKMRPKGASLSMELKNQLIAPLFDRKPESSLFVGNSSKEDDLLINNRKSDGFRPGQKHSIKERDTSGNVLGEGKANHNKNNIGQIASTTLQAHSTQLSSVSPKARPSTFNIINKSNFSKPKNSPKIELISRELNNPPKKLGQGKYLGIRTRELRCGCLGKEMNKEERETSAERMSEKKIDQESPEEKSLSPKRGILHHYPAGYLSASQSPKYICHSQRISQINEGGGEMVINTTPNTPILHGKQASPQQSPKTTPNKVARAGRWATVRSFSMGNDSYLKLQNKYRNRIQINTIINKCSEISRTSKQHNNLRFIKYNIFIVLTKRSKK